jgi:hypothetical protein
MFSFVLIYCVKKNLATLHSTNSKRFIRGGASVKKAPKEIFCGLKAACLMAYFQTKNPKLDKFLFAMEVVGLSYGHLVYFTTIWYIL